MGRGSSTSQASAEQLLLGRRLPPRNRPNQLRPSSAGLRALRALEQQKWAQAIQLAQQQWPTIDDDQRIKISDLLTELTINDLHDGRSVIDRLDPDATLFRQPLLIHWQHSLQTGEVPSDDASWQQPQARRRCLSALLQKSMIDRYATILADRSADPEPLRRLAENLPDTYSMFERNLIHQAITQASDPVQLPVLTASLVKRAARIPGGRSHQNFRERTNRLAAYLGLESLHTEQLRNIRTIDGLQTIHLAARDNQQTRCGLNFDQHHAQPAARGSWRLANSGFYMQACSVCAFEEDQVPATQEAWEWTVLGHGYDQALEEVQKASEAKLTKLVNYPPEYERWRNWQSGVNRQLDLVASKQLADQFIDCFGSGDEAWQRLLAASRTVPAQPWPALDRDTLITIISAYQPSKRNPFRSLQTAAARTLRARCADEQ